MAERGPESAPGVVASLRALLANSVGIIRTRLELFANELDEARLRTVEIVVLGVIAQIGRAHV